MVKQFAIITHFFLLGTISINKPLQAMDDPFQYGICDTMHTTFQRLIWGAMYDSSQDSYVTEVCEPAFDESLVIDQSLQKIKLS